MYIHYLNTINDYRLLNVQHASGKKFHEVIEDAFIRPLNIEAKFYIGIPWGIELRISCNSHNRYSQFQ